MNKTLEHGHATRRDNESLNLPLTRRTVIGGFGAAAILSATSSWAQQPSLLPVNTPGLDHLDVIVEDVEATAKFYMGLFNTTLHAQPFRGALRYFVLFGELKENRQVGYLAIGASQGRGTYIGHFCTSVYDYRRDSEALFAAMKDAFAAQGFGEFDGPTGFGGLFNDPDGIEIQFLPAPDTLVTAAEPSDLVPSRRGLVTPKGVDHVLVQVADLDRAVRYYRILYGQEARRDAEAGQVTFHFNASDTRLILEPVPADQKPRIAHFGIKVEAYDVTKVSAGLTALGAQVLAADSEHGVLRFRDIDGITVEIRAVV